MKIIEVKAGQIGYHHKGGFKSISDTIFKCANTRTATAIKQTGGTLQLKNVYIDGGTGPQIWGGDKFEWIGGGSMGTTRAYGVGYFGNIHPSTGTRIKTVVLGGLRFTHHSTDEALLRVMGCDRLDIINCEFDNTRNTAKQCVQVRHCKRVTISGSEILGQAVFGVLRAKDCKSEAERQAYHDDARKFRIVADFKAGSVLGGYCMLMGQVDMVAACDLKGPFTRPNCFSLETIAGIASPILDASKAVNHGWKRVR